MANLGGPGGELEKSIDKLIQFANQKASEFSADEDATLRKLAEDYEKDALSLDDQKKELATVYGNILRKIRLS